MYKEMDNQRMSDIEASENYPDSFIVMRKDFAGSETGTVLYIGDDQRELISLFTKFDDIANCGIVEGRNHRRSLGGVVVGG